MLALALSANCHPHHSSRASRPSCQTSARNFGLFSGATGGGAEIGSARLAADEFRQEASFRASSDIRPMLVQGPGRARTEVPEHAGAAALTALAAHTGCRPWSTAG